MLLWNLSFYFMFSGPNENIVCTLSYCITPAVVEHACDISIAQLCSLFLSSLHPHRIWSGWLLLDSFNPLFEGCIYMCVWVLKQVCSCMTHFLAWEMSKSLNAAGYILWDSTSPTTKIIIISIIFTQCQSNHSNPYYHHCPPPSSVSSSSAFIHSDAL